MPGEQYTQWLLGGDGGHDEPLVVSEENYMDPEEDGDFPKDYEAIRYWIEYSNSKNWLMETARVPDEGSTQSALPREHQVAVTLPRGEMEKWLIRPAADTLAGQLETKLLVSSENAPWLMSCAPKDDEIGKFSAILCTPNAQWLSKAEYEQLAKWIMGPKSSCDPLTGWKTFQETVDWNVDSAGDEESSSLPLGVGYGYHAQDDNKKWLLSSSAPSYSSLPLFGSTNPLEEEYGLDQSSRAHVTFDTESESSLMTLGSEYELVDEL